MSDQIVLHFEVFETKNPNTEIAANALLDWVALTKAAAAAIDPYDRLEFEIVGVTLGSTRFPQLIRFLDRGVENISSAWDDYPYIKKMVIGSAHTLTAAVVGAAMGAAMSPEVQLVEFTEKERKIHADMIEKVCQSHLVKVSQQKFYKTIEGDPAIKGVGVANDWHDKPEIIVPREEFSERSGLWEPESSAVENDRVATDIWDVVLLKAAFASVPETWRFSRDGLKFSAKMNDAHFLVTVKDGRVPINLQEGVTMRVAVERKETLNGQVWEPVAGTWKIVKVISPVPIAAATTLPFTKKP